MGPPRRFDKYEQRRDFRRPEYGGFDRNPPYQQPGHQQHGRRISDSNQTPLHRRLDRSRSDSVEIIESTDSARVTLQPPTFAPPSLDKPGLVIPPLARNQFVRKAGAGDFDSLNAAPSLKRRREEEPIQTAHTTAEDLEIVRKQYHEIGILKRDLNQERVNAKKVGEKCSQLEGKNRELSNQIITINRKLDLYEKERVYFKKEREKLNKECDRLNKELNEKKAIAEQANSLQSDESPKKEQLVTSIELQANIQTLEAKISKLEASNELLETERSKKDMEIKDLKKALEEKEVKISDLEVSIKDACDSIKRTSESKAKFEKESKDFEEQARQTEEALQKARNSLKSSNLNLEKARTQLDNKEKELEELHPKVTQLEQQIDSLTTEIQKIKEESETLKADHKKTLLSLIAQQTAKSDQHKKELESISTTHKEKVDGLQKELESVATVHKNKVDELEEKLREMSKTHKDKVDELEEKLGSMAKTHKDKVDELQKLLDEKETVNQSLLKKNQEVESKTSQSEEAAKNSTSSEIAKNISNAIAVQETLIGKFDQQAKQINQLETEKAELSEELKEERTRLKQLQEQQAIEALSSDSPSEMKRKIDVLQQENEKLLKQIGVLNNEVAKNVELCRKQKKRADKAERSNLNSNKDSSPPTSTSPTSSASTDTSNPPTLQNESVQLIPNPPSMPVLTRQLSQINPGHTNIMVNPQQQIPAGVNLQRQVPVYQNQQSMQQQFATPTMISPPTAGYSNIGPYQASPPIIQQQQQMRQQGVLNMAPHQMTVPRYNNYALGVPYQQQGQYWQPRR